MADDNNTSVTQWTGKITDPERTGPQKLVCSETALEKQSVVIRLPSPGLMDLAKQPHVVKLLTDAGIIDDFMLAHGFMQPKTPADALTVERAEEVCTIVNENEELSAIRDAVCEIMYAEANYQTAYLRRLHKSTVESELGLAACKNALVDVYDKYMAWGSFEQADAIRGYNEGMWNCVKGLFGEQGR